MNFRYAKGYSPLKTTSSNRATPGSWFLGIPIQATYGGKNRRSKILATDSFPSSLAHMEKNVKSGCLPLSGRLKISSSLISPLPPSVILPVPSPPMGKAIVFKASPVNSLVFPVSYSSSFSSTWLLPITDAHRNKTPKKTKANFLIFFP